MNRLLFRLYSVSQLRCKVQAVVLKLEGGEWYSKTLRQIYSFYHKVNIGLYSHGGCFIPHHFDKFTSIGRYCSIATTAHTFNRNHSLDFISTHAFFFNPCLKHCTNDSIEFIPLTIGHDVWMGHNSIVMPHVKEIGTGAVIAAGAVVNKDVPPYAIVVGNPARVVRFRFEPEVVEELLKMQWWQLSIEEIKKQYGSKFFTAYTQSTSHYEEAI